MWPRESSEFGARASPSPAGSTPQLHSRLDRYTSPMATLTNLPPELLHLIYYHLDQAEQHSAQARTWAHVCRALLPFTQAYRWRHVVLTSYAAAQSFVTAVVQSDWLGDLVHSLHLDLFDTDPSLDDTLARLENRTQNSIDNLDSLWPRLTKLCSVKLVNCSQILASLLAVDPCRCQLSSLSCATIVDHFAGNIDEPYSVDTYRNLFAAALHLTQLCISISHSTSILSRRNILHLHHATPALGPPSITHLSLSGYRPSHILSIAAFTNSFPALSSLSLNEFCGSLVFPPVLQLLRQPHLRQLRIGSVRSSAFNQAQFERLDLAGPFPVLEELVLGCGHCLPGFRLHLPPTATKLVFGLDTDVPLTELVELLQPGARHLPALRTVQLDSVRGKRGTSVSGPRGFPRTEATGSIIFQPHRDWVLPRWTEQTTAEGVARLLELAQRQEVSLTGSAIEAIGVERAWAEELEAVERAEVEALTRLVRTAVLDQQEASGAVSSDSDAESWEEW